MPVRLCMLFIAGLFAATFNALAMDELPVTASLFGTLGLAKSSNDDTYFRSRITLPTGIDRDWSFENDSKLGIQLSYEPSEHFSATVQALTELNVDDNYKASLEWAYVTFRPDESLTVRLGRTVFPTFMASDYTNVDFAYLPVRMPHDVYALVPYPGIDGVDVIYNTQVGSTYLQIQALAAQRDFDIFNEGLDATAYELRDSYSFRATLKQGNWSASAGLSRGDLKFDAPAINELTGILNSAAELFPGFGLLASEIADEGELNIRSLGVHYSGYRFTFMSEYVERRWDVNMKVSDTDAFYVLGGYHLGKLTPYAFYSESKNRSELPIDTYPTSGPLAPVTAAFSAYFRPIMGDGRTASVGLRYDLLENLALKAQYERIDPGASLYLVKNGQLVAQDMNLYSLALNFVY